MLTQIFKSVLLMSAVGGLLAVFWISLEPITRKLFSPRWQYYVWLTVLIVMIFPVRFQAPKNMSSIKILQTEQAGKAAVAAMQENIQATDIQEYVQAETSEISRLELPKVTFDFLAYVWLLGMLAVFLTRTVKYGMFLSAIKKSSEACLRRSNIPKRIMLRKTDVLDAPLLVGVLRPTLFLPSSDISEKDMSYILMHELTHYKRRDLWYKWFSAVVLSIHWFNPLAYIVSRRIEADCEISCDFDVTKRLSDSEKNDYMRMILELICQAKRKTRPLTTQMASDRKTLKRRFTMIGSKKKTNGFVSTVSLFAALAVLSTAVFASGLLKDLTSDDLKIEVYNGENKLTLKNDPFIYDGEYYLPLREVLSGFDIGDIEYENGEITVTIPKEKAKHETNVITMEIGSSLIHYGNPFPDGYGVVMRCAPILRGDTTFVTMDYFEDLMKSADISGFRLNVIRPTEPEGYRENGEKVFIGTAEEQDNYSGEAVKRIIIDENGEVIAVIPIEQQLRENIEKKFDQAEKCMICENFHQALYDQAFCCYDPVYDSVYESGLWFVEGNDGYIAYFSLADIVNVPQSEFNKDMYMTVTNTYGE